MPKVPHLTTPEQRFESAKKAARTQKSIEAATHDEKTAALKAQRLAKKAEKKPGETPSKRRK